MGEESTTSDPTATAETQAGDTATVEELFSNLSEVEQGDSDAETREQVRDVKHLLAEAHHRDLLDSGVRDLGASDAIQAFVGSVIFASPLLVEDGIFDIGAYLFGFTIASVPVFLVANTAFVVVMTYALLEWTGRNKTDTHLLAGVFPVRVLMVLAVSFLVSAALMTVWGRVGGWQSPTEALSRINVVWTVASLGAALGDIAVDEDTSPTVTEHAERDRMTVSLGAASVSDSRAAGTLRDSELVAAITREFEELASSVEDTTARARVQQIREETMQAALDSESASQIRKYTSRDIAEAFVGSIFFAVPFLIEDGVFDVATFFLGFQIGGLPVFFLVNTLFVLGMILALVYWAGPQDVRATRRILGVVPRRLVGIAVVSFLTTAAMMTMWGRVANWQDPVVAIARISVVWTVASFGASLGDILPGESSGADINEELGRFGE